jgi:hypothetical protein
MRYNLGVVQLRGTHGVRHQVVFSKGCPGPAYLFPLREDLILPTVPIWALESRAMH